uniref:Uncharacterized protein n=1 Tax=Accipiter nisus TaxID=211598 RepID=A0A8B9NYD9_9AVES
RENEVRRHTRNSDRLCIFILFIFSFCRARLCCGQASRTGGHISTAHYSVPSRWSAHVAM